jgi:hypothetical protein
MGLEQEVPACTVGSLPINLRGDNLGLILKCCAYNVSVKTSRVTLPCVKQSRNPNPVTDLLGSCTVVDISSPCPPGLQLGSLRGDGSPGAS